MVPKFCHRSEGSNCILPVQRWRPGSAAASRICICLKITSTWQGMLWDVLRIAQVAAYTIKQILQSDLQLDYSGRINVSALSPGQFLSLQSWTPLFLYAEPRSGYRIVPLDACRWKDVWMKHGVQSQPPTTTTTTTTTTNNNNNNNNNNNKSNAATTQFEQIAPSNAESPINSGQKVRAMVDRRIAASQQAK